MMQLVCNGQRLDLYDGTGLQFKHDNPLFAFDRISCERTTEFKLPATPVNDRLLACARIPAYTGEGMRRRFQAQMIDGTVIKDGYLYVSKFDGKDYTAILVTGELVGLQNIRNLGKLAELIDFGNTYVELNTSGYAANPNDQTTWLTVNYVKEENTDIMHPSIHLGSLYDSIKNTQHIAAETLIQQLKTKRIVIGDLRGMQELQMTFTGTEDSMIEAQTSSYVCYSIAVDVRSNVFTKSSELVSWHEEDNGVDVYYSGLVEQFIAMQDVSIKFPHDWDNDLYIGYFQSGGDTTAYSKFVFYGDRYFDANHNPVGESLRDRIVTIKKGQKFTIINVRNYLRSGATYGWYYDSGYVTQCNFAASGKVDQENLVGTRVFLQDNLPDITFIELVKTIAAILGYALDYTEEDGITFDELDFDSWNVKHIDDIISINEVSRIFADYAQHNIVRYDSDTRAMAKDYTIDNDNLEETKDLQVVPFGEGESSGRWLYLRREFSGDVMSTTAYGTMLAQQPISKIGNLQTLCDMSTQIKAKCRMTSYEYEGITKKTVLQVNGSRYVWTSRIWGEGVADFTLAKIA